MLKRLMRKLTLLSMALGLLTSAALNADLIAADVGADVTAPAELEIPDPDALDSILDGYIDDGFLPFVYARIEDLGGEVVYEHSRVNKALLGEVQADGDTWFRIWSMSKIVTIATLLDLVEDGIVNLEDPVVKFIPEFKELRVAKTHDARSLSALHADEKDGACPLSLAPVESAMTVMHLINHEAGFYYSTTGIPCIDQPAAKLDLASAKDSDELIARLASLPLIQQPGERYFYGTGTTVLGILAERATGMTLAELVAGRITGPLGIQGLQYPLPEGKKLLPRTSGKDGALRLARVGELDIFGQSVPDYDPQHRLYLGGEGMLATSDGYADFLRMLLAGGTLNGHRFLDEATVASLHAPHTLLDNPHGYNGMNLWVTSKAMREEGHGEEGLWIGGGYEGTHFWVDPKREFVALIMSQIFSAPEGGYEIRDDFRGALYKQFWESEGASTQ